MLDSREIVIQLRPPKSDVPDFDLNCSPNMIVRQLRERIIEAVKEYDPLMKITSDNVQLSASGEVLMAANLLPNEWFEENLEDVSTIFVQVYKVSNSFIKWCSYFYPNKDWQTLESRDRLGVMFEYCPLKEKKKSFFNSVVEEINKQLNEYTILSDNPQNFIALTMLKYFSVDFKNLTRFLHRFGIDFPSAVEFTLDFLPESSLSGPSLPAADAYLQKWIRNPRIIELSLQVLEKSDDNLKTDNLIKTLNNLGYALRQNRMTQRITFFNLQSSDIRLSGTEILEEFISQLKRLNNNGP